MNDRNQTPPTYKQLPAQLPPLSQSLPIQRHILDSIALESFETDAQLSALAIPMQQQPALRLAPVVEAGLLNTPAGGGNLVFPFVYYLVSSLMMFVLEAMGIPCTHAGHSGETSGAISNAFCPDWLLMLRDVLMFKVRAPRVRGESCEWGFRYRWEDSILQGALQERLFASWDVCLDVLCWCFWNMITVVSGAGWASV